MAGRQSTPNDLRRLEHPEGTDRAAERVRETNARVNKTARTRDTPAGIEN
jgi:hypothetical protein